MCLKILRNESWYRRISPQEVSSYRLDFIQIINSAKSESLIDGATLEFLTVTFLVTPTFYMLPNVYKSVVDPMGRPNVSRINSLTSRANILVDNTIKPSVQNLPTYLKDSLHLLHICQQLRLPPGKLLVTIDHVKSLYSNILHQKGIQTINEFLLKDAQHKCGTFILDLLFFILTHNYFMFDGSHYL